jgi:hypothetical protein
MYSFRKFDYDIVGLPKQGYNKNGLVETAIIVRKSLE